MTDDNINTWASAAEVEAITGKTVENVDVTKAQYIIDVVIGRTYLDKTNIRDRDITWLTRACAFQTAWMLGHPDLYSRLTFTQIEQDGMRAWISNKAAVYLAPLTIRALRNLSWIRTRSVRVKTPFTDRATDGYTEDFRLQWRPL